MEGESGYPEMPPQGLAGNLNWGALAQASPRLTSLTPAPGPCPTHSFLKEGIWKGTSDSSEIMWCLGRGLAHSRTNGVSRQGRTAATRRRGATAQGQMETHLPGFLSSLLGLVLALTFTLSLLSPPPVPVHHGVLERCDLSAGNSSGSSSRSN